MNLANRSGEEFTPVQYPGVDFATAREREASSLRGDDELYYRQVIFAGLSEEVIATEHGYHASDNLRIDAYQAWNELAWKTPHATIEAVKRFAAKTSEEAQEVDNAVEEYYDTRDPAHLLEEIGDFIWSITALASNGGAVISDGIKQQLFAHLHGVKAKDYITGDFVEPAWYDAVAPLTTKRGSLTFGDIAKIYEAGYIPPGAVPQNIYDHDEIGLTAFAFDFMVFGGLLGLRARNRFESTPNYRPLDPGSNVPEYAPDLQTALDMGKLAAELYLRAGAMAYAVGSDFGRVALTNIRKVNGRVTTGTVDKTDGARV